MKKNLIILFLFAVVFVHAQPNPNGWDTAWVSSFGGPSIDFGRDIKETSDKGFIIAGTTTSFGDGNSSFYLIKTDSTGIHQWSRSIGTSNNDAAYTIEISNDANYFVAGFSNWNLQKGYDGYLIKADNLGNVIWTKNYGGTDWDFIYNSCMMPDGGLILCGETYSQSNGGADGYLIRTDSNGDTLWTKKIGTTGNDAFYSVEQKSNRIYVVGKSFNVSTNKTDASIYKLDLSGNILSQSFFGNSTEDCEYKDLSITNASDILVCGKRTLGSNDFYIFQKIDTTNFSQLNSLSSTQTYYFESILEGYNNDVYTLTTSPGGLGGLSALYFRFTSGFSYLRNANFGGANDEEGIEMIKTSKGYAFIGSTTSYGNQNSSPDKNVYLVVFNKKNLVNDYYILLTEFQDNLPTVNIHENISTNQKATIYPNPVNSVFTIRFENTELDGKTINYQLFDQQGKLVSEKNIMATQNHIILDRTGVTAGIYTYRLKLNSIILNTGKISAE